MKILLLITDLEIGGTPTVVRELAIRLPADVACLAPPGPVADPIRAAGRAVTSFHARCAKDFPRASKELIQLIRREKFDVVFSFLIHANTVAAVASLFCRDVRFIQSIQTTQPTPRWHWWLQSIVHRAADTVVVPSDSVARVACDWSNIPRDKFRVIPNAVDRRSTGILPLSPIRTIGFIGRLDPIKRVPDLLAAMRLLPSTCRLEVFGDGAERANLERLADDRVTFHGAIQNPAEALARIDILVLPSEAEGFGLVLIEAMAAGVPVVATDVPGIRDVVIHNETGLLVPVADPPAIAAAILRLADDTALRERLIKFALVDVAGRFTWERVLPQYLRFLLERKDRPRIDTNARE